MGKDRAGVMRDEPMAKPSRSLVEHTDDVVTAYRALFGTPENPTELTRRWLIFFRLSPSDDLRPFLRNGLLACFLHDWGKANTGFAGMLATRAAQTVRHEVVSALLIAQPRIWRWLEPADAVDLPVVLGAVAGHHLKAAEYQAGEDTHEFGSRQAGSLASDFALTWDHPKIHAQLITLAKEFGLDESPPGSVPIIWAVERPGRGQLDYGAERKRTCKIINRLREDIEDAPASLRARMLRAVRSALIAADSAGSALFRTHEEAGRVDDIHDHIRSWIGAAFDPASRLDEAKVHSAVIGPRLEEIAPAGREFEWNEFQDACVDPGRVPPRSLLIAPCGSGKTLAAWRWVAARCRERPIARAIFLYPTRGTATEGFRDYVGHAGPELAALVHGTAQLDLEALQPDPSIEERTAQARLFSLQQWPKRVFSATADQFLAFLQHDYGSTCLLPLLADSAVVLDEVHSYDRGMFTALMQFLEHFDVPVLAMTATMIERRKADLAKHLTFVDGLGFSQDASRLRRIADHPRYVVELVAGFDNAKREAEAALGAGLRVLWVVNAVDRAQGLARDLAVDIRADRLATRTGTSILCYHSRFKLRDRRDRHADVVAAFKQSEGQEGRAVLGITTQVCELSLDLDCDVLITEYAPVSSLIQRFGRCCRDQKAHEEGRIRSGRVILYETESILPYNKDEMKGVKVFIGEIGGKVVSQSGLEERLAALDGAGFMDKDARFITDGPWAAAGQEHFRDGEDLTRQAIMPIDGSEYERLSKSPARYKCQELIVPISKNDVDPSEKPAWMPKWLGYADGKRHEYLPLLGYLAKTGGGHSIV